MPLKIVRPDHVEFVGEGYVLLTAPHAAGPETHLHTGQIVEDVALVSRSCAVIGKVSREYVDLNRIQAARTEFRKSIDALLADNGIRMVLDIHGKKDPGVDVGTTLGETASEGTTNLVREWLSRDFTVNVNEKYRGIEAGSIVTTYGRRSSDGSFAIEALQIEFGHEERTYKRDKVVESIAQLVALANRKFGFTKTDEPEKK